MRAEAGLRALATLVAVAPLGCALLGAWGRVDGDGGWTPAERHERLQAAARRSGVRFGTDPPATILPEDTALDLATALRLAERGNRTIAEGERSLDAAGARVRDAQGRLLPAMTTSGRYTWYTDSLRNQAPAFLAGTLPAGQRPSIVVRDDRFGTLNGTLTMPIDLSGEFRHALAAAQAGYRGERERLWATRLDQQLSVVRAYFQLLAARRLAEVTEEDVALFRSQVANAQWRFESGRLTKNQLLVAQVSLSNAEQELVTRQLAIDETRWALNQATGLDVDRPTEPVDSREPPRVPAVDDALAHAFEANPSLRGLLEQQHELEETERALVGRGLLPHVSGGGAIDYSTSDLLEPKDIGSGFVGFTWDIDTTGRARAAIAEARIGAERNRIEIERRMREIEALVRASHRGVEERLRALESAAAAVGQAEENVRIRQLQFDAGRATSEDVLDAQALLSRQRATRATALYEARLRAAELAALMGESPAATDAPKGTP